MRDEGREVFAELQQASSRARTLAEQARHEVAVVDQRAAESLARRSEAVLELARHYLPNLESLHGASAFAGIKEDIAALQRRRDGRMAELSSMIAQMVEKRAFVETEIETVTARLHEQVAKRGELEQQVAAQLKADPAFAPLAAQAAEAEQQLSLDEERAAQLQRDAAEKLPPYHNSRLFMYLHERQFGTSGYRSRGLTRRLDRFVADLIGYQKARDGFHFLTVTPAIVAEEVQRRREVFAELIGRVEAMEQSVADALGLREVVAEGERLVVARQTLVEESAGQQRTIARLTEELTKIERSEGEFYAEALTRLRTFLDQTKVQALAARAAETAEPEDDDLVRQIAEADAQIRVLKEEVERRGQDLSRLEGRAAGLERVARRFRERNYDATRSVFPGLDVQSEIDLFSRGETSFDELWSNVERRQQFVPLRSMDGVDSDRREGTRSGGSSTSRVLLSAMGHVLGAALRGAASRGIGRRGGGFRSSSGGGSGRGGGLGGGFGRSGGF